MHTTKLMSRLPLAAAVLLLSLTVGCGGGPDDAPELGTVVGTVTLDGKPVAGANVSFSPAEGRTSTATTDQQGHYELTYTATSQGAKVGTHEVRISTFQEGTDPDNPEVGRVEEKIPAKYNTATTLSKEVKPGENKIDFELTSQ